MGLINVVRHTIEATHSPAAMEARRHAVDELDPSVKKLAARAIDQIIFSLPHKGHFFNEASMAVHGFTYVGQGGDSIVFRHGDDVVKFDRKSAYMNKLDRRNLLESKQDDFSQLHTYMGAYLLPQVLSIEPHPNKKTCRLIQTRQPFVAFSSFVSTHRNQIIRWDDVWAPDSQQLSQFIDAAWAMYDATRLLPDLLGPDNIVTVDNSLVLLDSQPVDGSIPTAHDQTKRHLDQLAQRI